MENYIKRKIYHPPLLLNLKMKYIKISDKTTMILSRDLPMLCHDLNRNPCPFYHSGFGVTNCNHPERDHQELCTIPNDCPLPGSSRLLEAPN